MGAATIAASAAAAVLTGMMRRLARTHAERDRLEAERQELAISKAGQKPISAGWLGQCLREVINEDDIILDESITNSPMIARQIPRSQPGTMFGSGGSNLGWGLGAAMGAKLASPEKTVILLVGDGSFVFGCPTAALWAASKYGAPFLTVIFNNGKYYAPQKAHRMTYGYDSFSEKSGSWAGYDITPPPDYALIATACGAQGKTVTEPDELKPALVSALDEVRRGQPVVVNVLLDHNL